ncbi:hypothetical protein GBA52_007082 [Prunus armeniaca]|nr:hypothetical protein GBA52_007082 [Prunus armeniaca]
MYKSKRLVDLVDSRLEVDGNFSEKEAIEFLKLGLLCVQEKCSLRPRMSTAIKLMTMMNIKDEVNMKDEMNMNLFMNVEICEPGVITDKMDLKIAHRTDRSSPLSIFTMPSPQPYPFRI